MAASLFFLLLLWQTLASMRVFPAYLLPGPLTVLGSALHLWQSGLLIAHLSASLARIAAGFGLSALLGCALAALTYRSALLDDLLAAPLALLRMIPPLALTPLLILWLGIGWGTHLAIIILSAFFPIFMNTRAGLHQLSAEQLELARSLHLSGRVYLSRVLLPCAVPQIVTGLRLAFSYSWRILIGAELIGAASGLGYLIMSAQGMLHTDEVLVGILSIGLIGWILDALFIFAVKAALGRRFPELAA